MPNSSLIDLKERPSLSITMYLSNTSRSCFLRIIKPQKFFVQTFGVTSTLMRFLAVGYWLLAIGLGLLAVEPKKFKSLSSKAKSLSLNQPSTSSLVK